MKKVVLHLNILLFFMCSFAYGLGFKGDVDTSSNNFRFPNGYKTLSNTGNSYFGDNDGSLNIKTSNTNSLLNGDVFRVSAPLKQKQVTFVVPKDFYTTTPYYNILYNDNDTSGGRPVEVKKIIVEKDNETFNYGTLIFSKKNSTGTVTKFDYITVGTGKRFSSVPDNDGTIPKDGNLQVELDNDDNGSIKKLDIYIIYGVKG